MEVACEACDFCGDCFRIFVAAVDLASTIVRTHSHSVHVQDLYMYTYARLVHVHICTILLSDVSQTVMKLLALLIIVKKLSFMFFSAGSIGTLVCHSHMLRGGFLALKNTIYSKASGAAPRTPHGGSAPLTPAGGHPRPPYLSITRRISLLVKMRN